MFLWDMAMRWSRQCLNLLAIALLGGGQVVAWPWMGREAIAYSEVSTLSSRQKIIEADNFLKQGDKQSEEGQVKKALISWNEALLLYRLVKHLEGEGKALNKIGYAYLKQAQYQKSIQYLESALVIGRKIKDLSLQISILQNLGINYHFLNDSAQADIFFARSNALHSLIGKPREYYEDKLEAARATAFISHLRCNSRNL